MNVGVAHAPQLYYENPFFLIYFSIVKLENIMFESKSPDAEIKVIDFGLSKSFTKDRSVMTKWVGTLYTMAPQVIQGVYTSQADLWSVGVITYVLLSNSKPFYHTKR